MKSNWMSQQLDPFFVIIQKSDGIHIFVIIGTSITFPTSSLILIKLPLMQVINSWDALDINR